MRSQTILLEKAEPHQGGECWLSTMEFDEHDQTASGDDPTFDIDEEANLFRSPTEEDMIAFNDSRQARETK